MTGAGSPVTVFAHGLGAGIDATRPFGSGVLGTRVFMQFRGHGDTPAPPGPWTYDDLAAELRRVADHHAATRAVGISLGAAALIGLLAETPDRFDRVALLLPAVATSPRPDRARRDQALPAAADDGTPIHPEYTALLRRAPIDDPARLAAVTAPVLILGQADDPAHPTAVASELASALPNARLELFPPGGVLTAHRAVLRTVMRDFLAD